MFKENFTNKLETLVSTGYSLRSVLIRQRKNGFFYVCLELRNKENHRVQICMSASSKEEALKAQAILKSKYPKAANTKKFNFIYEEQIKQIIELYYQGLSVAKISKTLTLSTKQVDLAIQKHMAKAVLKGNHNFKKRDDKDVIISKLLERIETIENKIETIENKIKATELND